MSLKRVISFFMACVLFTSIVPGIEMMDVQGINGSFSGGNGTSANPYIIEDVWDLQNMSGNLSAFYILKNDINASATINWNSGAGFVPVGSSANKFIGSLDGKNHTIAGLFINRSATNYVGLFGYIYTDGSIKNLGLVDNNITGRGFVGGLIGYARNCIVEKSYASGNLTGTDYVGGLVGYLDNTTINNSYAMGNVKITGNNAGGLVGFNEGIINNSYASGNFSGNSYVGGLAGENVVGKVFNSYAAGTMTGNSYVGGLVGFISIGTISNSFYNINKTLLNGKNIITIGGLFDSQYQDWYSSSFSLNISDYSATLIPSGEYYNILNF